MNSSSMEIKMKKLLLLSLIAASFNVAADTIKLLSEGFEAQDSIRTTGGWSGETSGFGTYRTYVNSEENGVVGIYCSIYPHIPGSDEDNSSGEIELLDHDVTLEKISYYNCGKITNLLREGKDVEFEINDSNEIDTGSIKGL